MGGGGVGMGGWGGGGGKQAVGWVRLGTVASAGRRAAAANRRLVGCGWALDRAC